MKNFKIKRKLVLKQKAPPPAVRELLAEAYVNYFIELIFLSLSFLLPYKVLKRSLFGKTPDMYKKLKISILLNTLNSLKVKKKLDSELPTVIL